MESLVNHRQMVDPLIEATIPCAATRKRQDASRQPKRMMAARGFPGHEGKVFAAALGVEPTEVSLPHHLGGAAE
jgi:hypothetical protein